MKLTETERIILENTSKEYKYITRDKCGDLYIYKTKPEKETTYWISNDIDCKFDMFCHLFQDIKWEDEEPLQFRNDKGEFIL